MKSPIMKDIINT